jgi:hypothetical protein
VNHVESVDLVLKELVETRHPSVSVRRVFKKHRVKYTDELIKEVEQTLNSKSLVKARGEDSAGYTCYALSETGTDFIKSFGSYDKFLKGLETEQIKVERARKKKPYDASKNFKGEAPAPYSPPEKTYLQRNGLGLILLVFFIILFIIVARVSG